MNKQAILHIPDSQYCYPTDTRTVTLRLRTAAADCFDEVAAIYGSKYEYHCARKKALLERKFCDGNYAYYTVSLRLNDVRLVYVFLLTKDGKEYYFSEDGLTEEYDFDKAYYNSFQLPFINAADVMPVVSWMRGAVFYNIFVDRFFRGSDEKDDGYINLEWGKIPSPKSFSGGDIAGITKKLDYLAGLGVSALYLTPIFCSVSNHKYDIYDYYAVDPHFGSDGAFKELVENAHKRGMKVVLDAVFNHCSCRLPQFCDVAEKGKGSPYYTWFLIDGEKPDPEICNYQCFSSCNYMPKFNTSNPDVQDFLIDVALYWIKNFDVDGWRLDVSDEVSHDFWRRFRKAVKGVKPDCVIVGENWHDAHPFLCGDQYDGIMNYALTKVLLDFFAEGTLDAKGLSEKLNALYVRNTEQVNFMMMNLLDSHDTHRFYSLAGKDTDKLICALAVIFLHPGAASVYYGTEVPLEGGYDPDCRRTMDWRVENTPSIVGTIISQLAAVRRKDIVKFGDVRFCEKDGLFILERLYGDRLLRLTVSNGDEKIIVPQGELICGYRLQNNKLSGCAFMIEEVAL